MNKNEQKNAILKKIQNQNIVTIIGGSLIIIFTICLFLMTSIPSNAKKIVLMGDSITQSWSSYSPGFFENNSYLINKGISGETTPEMLARFDNDVIGQNPDVVIILAGINDIAQNTGYRSVPDIFKNIVDMVSLAKAAEITPVICSVLPANVLPWREEVSPADLVIELNLMLKDFCAQKNIIYVDYFSEMVGLEKELRKELTYDGIHPDKNGYLVMEKILLDVVKKLF